MADQTPSCSIYRNLIQLKKKIITASGSSIEILKGINAKKIKEKQIFSKSKIHFLILIGEKSYEKAFFLALSSKRIALFQLKRESPIAIFKLDEKIVDHGTVEVLDMERRKEGEFRVRLIIPIAFYSGTIRKMRLTVNFRDSQITKQKMKCVEELSMEDEKMRFCADLGNGNLFGFYEDTVVKSDSVVTRAEEPSTKKKRRIAVVARELWNGNLLFATENGSIRVLKAKDGEKIDSDSMNIFSEGQCIPPYCTLRCRAPSVIISTENIVIVGTQRGEVHFLNEQLKLICKIDTEGGPINCLKVDENDTEFLLVGFESGELRVLFMPDSEQNELLKCKDEDYDNCDGDDLSVKKKSRKRKNAVCKKSETELECLEKGCYYKTRSAACYAVHLRTNHNTTLALAGLMLRCQCGFESISWHHSSQCKISNFTVVRHDFGPIRTLLDKKMTPKCTMCEVYPKTVGGYAEHLYVAHNTYLDKIGHFLQCYMCGGNFYTRWECKQHAKKCKSRFYKLLKLGEDVEKKDETEMDQTADAQINQ